MFRDDAAALYISVLAIPIAPRQKPCQVILAIDSSRNANGVLPGPNAILSDVRTPLWSSVSETISPRIKFLLVKP